MLAHAREPRFRERGDHRETALASMPARRADVADLERNLGYHPRTTVEEGAARFVDYPVGGQA